MTLDTYKHINLEYLEMMADGDLDMKKTMLEMLMEELPGEIEMVENSVAASDYNSIKAIAHKLKSTLAFVGNDALTALNEGIEEIAIIGGSLLDIQQIITQMKKHCTSILKEIQTEYTKL